MRPAHDVWLRKVTGACQRRLQDSPRRLPRHSRKSIERQAETQVSSRGADHVPHRLSRFPRLRISNSPNVIFTYFYTFPLSLPLCSTIDPILRMQQ